MQTFLPYSDFVKSALVLDNKRLGNQRLEGLIILRAITEGNGWSNHKVCKMWSGYEEALKLYINVMICEWVRRGYKNNMKVYDVNFRKLAYPWWLGMEEFHSSHRAALLAKDYSFYSQFRWPESPKINYFWPE